MNYKKEGNKFHRMVEQLLKSAGAEIIKSDPNAKGSDIILKLDGNKVIVQCKYSPDRNKIPSIDTLIDSYARKVQKNRAKVAILALGNYQVPKNYIEKRSEILQRDKVAIWTNNTLKSYKNIVGSINRYAKYQIMGDLGIGTTYETFEVDAIPINQRGFKYYLTKLPPSFLLKAGCVARRVEDPKTYQRYITKKRVKQQIPSYIKEELGIFPNSVILISSYPLRYLKNKLEMRNSPSSLWILDGQHRVYAFANIPDPDMKDKFEIICSIFDGRDKKMDHNAQAQLFVKINNEAKKVPASLITDLAENFQGIGFHKRQINLMRRLSSTVMFKGRFKTYSSEHGILNPTTFCTNQAMIRLTKEKRGLIFKNIGEVSNKKEEDRAFNYLRDYFKLVAHVLKKEWNNPSKYILCTDKGIRGLLNFYEKILEYTKYRNNTEKIRKVLKEFKKAKPELRNSELKNQFLGEGGAKEMANTFAEQINAIIPKFAPTLEAQRIQGEVIDSITVYNKKDKEKAKKFILDTFDRYFEEKVIGELMHIDETTFSYIEELSKKCKKIHLCFQDMRSDDKKRCGEILNKLKDKGIDIILTKKRVHERWIATDTYLLMLNTDLKDDAISSKKNTKELLKINRNNEKIIKFKEDWDYFKRMEGDTPEYDYNPLSE